MCNPQLLEEALWAMLVGELELERMKILGKIMGRDDLWGIFRTAVNTLDWIILRQTDKKIVVQLSEKDLLAIERLTAGRLEHLVKEEKLAKEYLEKVCVLARDFKARTPGEDLAEKVRTSEGTEKQSGEPASRPIEPYSPPDDTLSQEDGLEGLS